LPCSNSIMMATDVTGLVMEAIEKSAFTGIAISRLVPGGRPSA
jgi:hypothetical protein